MALVGLILTYLSLTNLYGSANSCLAGDISCDVVSEKSPLATLGSLLVVIGAAAFWIGVVYYVIMAARGSRTKR